MEGGFCQCLRSRVIEFLIQAAELLEVQPIVKYSALSLFSDRFCQALSRPEDGKGTKSWLLHPLRESNLQLFSLASLWIASKIHDTHSLSVKSLKSLGDKLIKEQHYTKGDLLEAVRPLFLFLRFCSVFFKPCADKNLQEMVLLQVLKYEIGTSNIVFILLEELLTQLKVVALVGVHVKFEACMDIMDLLYENEVTSVFYSSPQALAASILVVAYVTTVPLPRWEFPVLPWVKFVTSCKDEEIMKLVETILKHIFQ